MRYFNQHGGETTEHSWNNYVSTGGAVFLYWRSQLNHIYLLKYVGTESIMWEFIRVARGTGLPSLYRFSYTQVPNINCAYYAWSSWADASSLSAPAITYPGDVTEIAQAPGLTVVPVYQVYQEPETNYTCPLCKNLMAERKGKFGKFYSCSSWSKTRCPGTLNGDGKPSKKMLAMMKKEKKDKKSDENKDVVSPAIDMLDL